jgi:hypothetical protein
VAGQRVRRRAAARRRSGAAAGAAAMAPFLVSATGVGYEQQAYLWIGHVV